jgi:4-hydroxyphenylacetate 3-monooxygenase
MPHSFTAAVESADGTSEKRVFDVTRMYNLGSATRDAQVAVHHQEEVAAAGVRIAFDIPAPRIYPIAPYALTTSDVVEVHGDRTSGEVEIVLVVTGDTDDDIYVGVGSDHTDRELERVSIVYSKQTCPNVLAPTLWRLSEVADHWDECVLESWVDDILYQQTPAGTFLSPKDLLKTLRERADVPDHGFVLYAGTIVALQGQLAYGSRWSFRLHDPVLDRQISHTYRLDTLMAEMADDFRVPLTVEAR